MALSMLSSTLSFQAGAAPMGGATRSAVSMQLAPAVGESVRSATFVPGSPVGMTGQQVDSSILVQGGSLRTWSYRSPASLRVPIRSVWGTIRDQQSYLYLIFPAEGLLN